MARRTRGLWLAGLLVSTVARAQTVSDPALTVDTVVTGLSVPTVMAFLGPNDFLVLQKNNGQVRRVVNGQLQATPVLDVNVNSVSERGLLGIAISSENPPGVFLYYTESGTGADSAVATDPILGNRIYRYTWNGSQLVNPVLVRNLPVLPGANHDGGTLLLGPGSGLAGDGRPLYAVIGDLNRDGQLENYENGAAPDDTAVILRLQQNGATDPNNPALFPYCSNAPQTTCTSDAGCPGGACRTIVRDYFAYGVRNSFGLTVDPVTGNIWNTENGPNLWDEVNLVAPGFNSGWEDYMGPAPSESPEPAGLFHIPGSRYSNPEFSWFDTLAPTAILFPVGSALGPAYDSVALVADNNTGSISRFPLNATRTGFQLTGLLADLVANDASEAALVRWGTSFGSSTDLKVGPDGMLYVVSIGRGTVYRVSPVGTPTPTAVPPTPTRTPTRTATAMPPTPTRTPTAIPPTPTRTPTAIPPTPTRTATMAIPPTPTRTPTVAPPTPTAVPATMHVGDLDRSSANLGKNWQATVTITTHDGGHSALAGAVVSGSWTGPISGSSSCTTAANGSCGVTSPLVRKKNGSVTFTVNNVSASGRTYQPGANHDPDGDSNGTTINALKP